MASFLIGGAFGLMYSVLTSGINKNIDRHYAYDIGSLIMHSRKKLVPLIMADKKCDSETADTILLKAAYSTQNENTEKKELTELDIMITDLLDIMPIYLAYD